MDDLEEELIGRKLDEVLEPFDSEIVQALSPSLTDEDDERLTTVGEAFLAGYLVGNLQVLRTPSEEAMGIGTADVEDLRTMIDSRDLELSSELSE